VLLTPLIKSRVRLPLIAADPPVELGIVKSSGIWEPTENISANFCKNLKVSQKGYSGAWGKPILDKNL
jgi:hypothetical protein